MPAKDKFLKYRFIMERVKIDKYQKIQKKLDRFKKENRSSPTRAEFIFKKELQKHKIKFLHQKYFYCETFQCIVDFYIGTHNINLVIEIDGGYHLTEEQQRKDNFRSQWLITRRRCKIIRFTNEEVINDPKKCILIIGRLFLQLVTKPDSNNYKIFSNLIHGNS